MLYAKKIFKTLIILAFCVVLFNISSLAHGLDFSFLPITGLTEAIENAENEATELIPDEIKRFISGLNDKLRSVCAFL